MLSSLNRDKDFYQVMYDDIIIPQELMGCHYKKAITLRNCWMINQSDYVIAFTIRDFGGAYNAVKYAEKANKKIISISDIDK